VQEHERSLGSWQAEWATFPALALITSGGVKAVADISQGLEVDKERMRANLETTRGLVMAEAVSCALAAKLGRKEHETLVQKGRRKGIAEALGTCCSSTIG
jgi:3-carboxy-cis,cis-muconate cycloisomerase